MHALVAKAAGRTGEVGAEADDSASTAANPTTKSSAFPDQPFHRRVRHGRAGVKTFTWEKPRGAIPPKAKDVSEFEVVAKREAELAARFGNERKKFDAFLDPGRVKPAEGSRQACGRRSVRY